MSLKLNYGYNAGPPNYRVPRHSLEVDVLHSDSRYVDILGQVVEQPLNCYQSSIACSGGMDNLPYSECCSTGSESFVINGSCYACAGMYNYY